MLSKRFTGYMKWLLEPKNSAEVGMQWAYEKPDDERYWLIADLAKLWQGYRRHDKEPEKITADLFYKWARAQDELFEVRNDNHSRILIRFRNQRSKQKRVPTEKAEAIVVDHDHDDDTDDKQQAEPVDHHLPMVDAEKVFARLFGLEFQLHNGATDAMPLVGRSTRQTLDACFHRLPDGVSLRDYLLKLHNNGPVLCDSLMFVQLLANGADYERERRMWLGLHGGGAAHAFLYRSPQARFVAALVPDDWHAKVALTDKLASRNQWLYGPDANDQYVGLTNKGPVWRTIDEWSRVQALTVATELAEAAEEAQLWPSPLFAQTVLQQARLYAKVQRNEVDIDRWTLQPVNQVDESRADNDEK